MTTTTRRSYQCRIDLCTAGIFADGLCHKHHRDMKVREGDAAMQRINERYYAPQCDLTSPSHCMHGMPLLRSCEVCKELAAEVPHCLACNENPAAEDDELCLPCATLRDAQPVRQENAENPFRDGRGDVLSEPTFTDAHLIVNGERVAWESFWRRLEREYANVKHELDRDSLREHLEDLAGDIASASLVYELDVREGKCNASLVRESLDAAMSRAALLMRGLSVAAVGSMLALATAFGGASAADYQPTPPIGCTITHYFAQDDMSAIAVCAGGYLVTKQDGPVDDWDDIPMAIDTLVLTDANGGTHEWPIWD